MSLAVAAQAAGPDPDRDAVVAAAEELALRLRESAPVSAWAGESRHAAILQGDVNRIALLSLQLAHELAAGEDRAETRAVYMQLREAAVRILARSRATGSAFPREQASGFRRLMGRLESYYGERPLEPAPAHPPRVDLPATPDGTASARGEGGR